MNALTAALAALLLALASQSASAQTLELVEALRDDDPEVRIVAAELLGDPSATGTAVVRALAARLLDQDETWRVRTAAATALGVHARHRPTAARPLERIVRMDDCDWRVRAAAVEALWASGEDGVMRLACSEQVVVATPAGPVPMPVRDGADVESLDAALAHGDPRVRRLAGLALVLARCATAL